MAADARSIDADEGVNGVAAFPLFAEVHTSTLKEGHTGIGKATTSVCT